MIFRWQLPSIVVLFTLVAGVGSAETRAEKAHRPLNGINGFIEACLSKDIGVGAAHAAFTENGVSVGLPKKINGKFPAGVALHDLEELGGSQVARNSKSNSDPLVACEVHIRGDWLERAIEPVSARLQAVGLRKAGPYPRIPIIPHSRLKHSNVSGTYSGWGSDLAVSIALHKQRGSKFTVLQIYEIPPNFFGN